MTKFRNVLIKLELQAPVNSCSSEQYIAIYLISVSRL